MRSPWIPLLLVVLLAAASAIYALGVLQPRLRELERRDRELDAALEELGSRAEDLTLTLEESTASAATLQELLGQHDDALEDQEVVLDRLGATVAELRGRLEALESGDDEPEVVPDAASLGALSSRVQLIDEELADHQLRVAEEAAERERRLDELAASLDPLLARSEDLPDGTILPWLSTEAGATPPEPWLVCDGRAGTPDLRGLFLRGASPGQDGLYGDPSVMAPAGHHTHSTENVRNVDGLPIAPPREAGDRRLLFDTDSNATGDAARASHGEHLHADENVPAHFTVVFVIKSSGG